MWSVLFALNLASASLCQIQIEHRYPHDPQAFTQGLLYHAGHLYESTGLYGHSSLRQVELESGKVTREKTLATLYFAEGLALWEGKLIQLTWKEKTAFVQQLDNFKELHTFHYETEGWGLTQNTEELIMSNGSAILRFLNPQDFSVQREITVTDKETPIPYLNELEWYQGDILANIWYSDKIAQIDAITGTVKYWIDASDLVKKERKEEGSVLNGIAYDAAKDRLFITGKQWSSLYEVKVICPPAP